MLLNSLLLLLSCVTVSVLSYDNSRSDNLMVYYGQTTTADQTPLSNYCNDDRYNVLALSFLVTFNGPGGMPALDVGNACNNYDFPLFFPGTNLPSCSSMASDIEFCQSRGKIVTLAIGGAGADVGLSSEQNAQNYAYFLYSMFLSGGSNVRPFGSAALDGVVMDVESSGSPNIGTFITTLRSIAQNFSKPIYTMAAPQCPFPDANVGAALNEAYFDAVYVQFYNNYCGLDQFNAGNFNFGVWDNWAKTASPNPNVKVYIGAPGSDWSAQTGYVESGTLANIVQDTRSQYTSFGGVSLWEATDALDNDDYGQQVRNILGSQS